jgi:flagella basal body P-ring formation protein FlgA
MRVALALLLAALAPALDIEPAARAAVATADDEITVQVSSTTGPLAVSEDARLVAQPLIRAASGRIPVRVRAYDGAREVGSGLVVLDVRRFRRVPVAAVDLPRGTVIGLEHLAMERMEVLPAATDLLPAPEAAVGLVVVRDVPAGAPVRTGFLIRPPLVKPGPVTLVYARDGVVLSGAGEAIGHGHLGDIIAVRRGDGRTIKARISGPGMVQVP